MRVLVVDDDSQLRTLLTNLLKSDGYEHVTSVEKPFLALEMTSEGTADVLFLDWKIPDVPNLGLMRAIHKQRPMMPIIMMSGFAEDQNILEAKKAGAIFYLKKPFTKEEMREALLRAWRYIQHCK